VSPPEDGSGPPKGAGAEITGTADDGRRRHRSTMRRLARNIADPSLHGWWLRDVAWRQRAGKAS
jgi:hypothetical protein